MNLAPVDWGVIAVTGLAVGLALIALAAIYSPMPSPRRAVSPPAGPPRDQVHLLLLQPTGASADRGTSRRGSARPSH